MEKKNQQPHIAFDIQTALDNVAGDKALLFQVFSIFIDKDVPRRVNEILEAIAENDSQKLRYAAHSLKGAVSNFAAQRARELAYKLEKAGEHGNFADVAESFEKLRYELFIIEEQFREAGWKKV